MLFKLVWIGLLAAQGALSKPQSNNLLEFTDKDIASGKALAKLSTLEPARVAAAQNLFGDFVYTHLS
ncbi:hypothetical protein MFIFM68171_02616 [Madurella fahalii]|uniref:Uncharacterized protein n=1 Tax=Madurella fahalii TaxID=1157608 RepID=A0ABQ0G3S2_9PEZI